MMLHLSHHECIVIMTLGDFRYAKIVDPDRPDVFRRVKAKVFAAAVILEPERPNGSRGIEFADDEVYEIEQIIDLRIAQQSEPEEEFITSSIKSVENAQQRIRFAIECARLHQWTMPTGKA